MHVLSVVGSFVDDQGMVDPEVETPGLVVSPLGGSAVVGLAAAVDNAVGCLGVVVGSFVDAKGT